MAQAAPRLVNGAVDALASLAPASQSSLRLVRLRSFPRAVTMRRRSVLLAALLVASSTASAQHIVGVRDARALAADSVFQAFDRTDSPGCSLGVYQDGKIQYARGYGMASLE